MQMQHEFQHIRFELKTFIRQVLEAQNLYLARSSHRGRKLDSMKKLSYSRFCALMLGEANGEEKLDVFMKKGK